MASPGTAEPETDSAFGERILSQNLSNLSRDLTACEHRQKYRLELIRIRCDSDFVEAWYEQWVRKASCINMKVVMRVLLHIYEAGNVIIVIWQTARPTHTGNYRHLHKIFSRVELRITIRVQEWQNGHR